MSRYPRGHPDMRVKRRSWLWPSGACEQPGSAGVNAFRMAKGPARSSLQDSTDHSTAVHRVKEEPRCRDTIMNAGP